MSEQHPGDMEEAYRFLSQADRDGGSKASRTLCCTQSYLEVHTLDLLPCAIDRLAVSAISDESQERKEQATLVLQELLKHGSPKELSLSLENQLGVATDEITQCFYLDEDEGGTESHEEDAVKNVNEGETAQKSLKDVHNRLLLVLETHSQVLNRLRYKKGTAGIIMAQNFTERLDLLLAELLQALQAGESLSVKETRRLLSALAEWCRSVFLWAEGLQASTEELDSLRIKLVDLLLQYFVLFHPRMNLLLLERGYRAMFPDAMLSRKNARSAPSAEEGKDLVACEDAIISSLSILGLSSEGHAEWMLGTRRNNSDGRYIYYPIAALILTTWELVESLSTDREAMANHPVTTAVKGGIDMLTVSLPILGSALNGLAKDAGHMWIWWIVHQMQSQGQVADRDEVSMLLELIMPNLPEDPSDVARFALHRLFAALLSLVKDPEDRITLYEQLVSSENPFETVRLSSLALLREDISAALRSEGGDSIIHDGSFWDILAPIILALPETDPPFGDLSLEKALQDSTVPWIMECVKILLLLLSPGSSVEKRCKAYVRETELISTWISPLRSALDRWQMEAPLLAPPDSAGEPGAVEGAMMLYSLEWTLEQVEAKLQPAQS
ncbi:hypothetical protein QFC20_001112 [Naganishia adeliensis]|uniref:Uncharacterized protein n=1 Tax=Naganishia adeliensis TaxID=92952 RepID=A0ACC2WVR0_9TREE|nr:hypothetical protein QFC20_001112 [Naganishia adeliensis]